MSLDLQSVNLNPDPNWSQPIQITPDRSLLDLFDQNGYDLTELEKIYALANQSSITHHRGPKFSLRQDWFHQEYQLEGPILNHAFVFERKGYTGPALDQLKTLAEKDPVFYKLVNYRPKWGVDFSMDYCGRDGSSFEILHYEYDGFSHEEIESVRKTLEKRFLEIDWVEAGQDILRQKDQWHPLEFFEQSEWKCRYFGIPKERFKMVAWK